MIGPESAKVLQLIAGHRRILQEDPDIPAEVLRATLLGALDALEDISLSLDQLEQAARALLIRSTTGSTTGNV